MNASSLQTLVNFRANKILLEAFDNVCLLSGKTRTQVLSEMMRQRVSTAGSKLPIRLAKQREMENRIRTAVEARSVDDTVDQPRTWSKALYGRLKSFSSFDRAGG